MFGLFKKKNSDKKTVKMLNLSGQPIVKYRGEGCQAMDVMEWMGRVVGFENDKVKIQIIKYNNSYGDIRGMLDKIERGIEVDKNQYPIYKYPIMSTDIQCVEGCWILFT